MDRVRKQLGVDEIEEGMGNEPVTVAVLDSGVEASHPDLEGKVMVFRDFVQGRENPYDDYGHGSHVCGCIAGTGAVLDGRYAGIAPASRLVVGKVLDRRGDGSVKKMAEALRWIIDIRETWHIRVLNISIGTGKGYENKEYSEVRELLDEAWYKGVMIVCAAGNAGPAGGSLSVIGRNRNIITVGCHEGGEAHRFGRPCQLYSSRGEEMEYIRKPDIVAPGTEVMSCKTFPFRGRSVTEKYYCRKSGTSMATAIVSGCCARFFEKNGSESNEYCKRRMLQTAFDMGEPWNKQGYGMIVPKNFI